MPKRYCFEDAEHASHERPKKFRMETNLVWKQVAIHLSRGYKFINLGTDPMDDLEEKEIDFDESTASIEEDL